MLQTKGRKVASTRARFAVVCSSYTQVLNKIIRYITVIRSLGPHLNMDITSRKRDFHSPPARENRTFTRGDIHVEVRT